MPPFRLLETAIHVTSVRASRHWYARVFGIEPLNPNHDDRLCAMSLPGAQVLLIFRQGGSTNTLTFPSGTIPPHDCQGTTHVAFAIAESDLPAWRAHLAALNIPIESEMKWDRGGTSLYFRDPDQHLLELVTPGVWATY